MKKLVRIVQKVHKRLSESLKTIYYDSTLCTVNKLKSQMNILNKYSFQDKFYSALNLEMKILSPNKKFYKFLKCYISIYHE